MLILPNFTLDELKPLGGHISLKSQNYYEYPYTRMNFHTTNS